MKIQSAICALLFGLVCNHHTLADTEPATALDALHQAGARADPAAFLLLLTTDAVFLGVNGNTRLEGQSLRDFVSTNFSRGGAWNYHSDQRDIRLSADGAVAWFDESLEHDQLGHGRGSGVLVKNGGGWRIAQYNLTLPASDHLVMSAAPSNQETAAPKNSDSTGLSDDPAAIEATTTEPKKRTQCRKIRHKTNKRARC